MDFFQGDNLQMSLIIFKSFLLWCICDIHTNEVPFNKTINKILKTHFLGIFFISLSFFMLKTRKIETRKSCWAEKQGNIKVLAMLCADYLGEKTGHPTPTNEIQLNLATSNSLLSPRKPMHFPYSRFFSHLLSAISNSLYLKLFFISVFEFEIALFNCSQQMDQPMK